MEIKQLIELKKRELEELRKKRYEIEKELETNQRGEVDGDNSKIKMG